MKTIQLESGVKFTNGDNDDLLRSAGVKRIFPGWYTVWFNGVVPDNSTVNCARRNRKGKLNTITSGYRLGRR